MNFNAIFLPCILLCSPIDCQGDAHIAALSKFEPQFEKSDKDERYISIRIDSRSFSDGDLSHVTKLKDLELIVINEGNLSDEGIACLSDLRSLKYLVLRGNSKLNGVRFANLKNNGKLETLTLSRCPITDEGLKSISSLESLRSLNLVRSKVTDDGLRHLTKLGNLENLWLSETSVTNNGVKNIEGLPLIKSLFLSKTTIDDGCFGSIGVFRQLTWLDISETKVSDKSIEEIKNLKRLKVLKIQKTKITAEGVKALKSHFPDSLIEADEVKPNDPIGQKISRGILWPQDPTIVQSYDASVLPSHTALVRRFVERTHALGVTKI